MNDTERLEHKIKCLENRIEHFENIPSEYKYVWDKDWDDMTEAERTAYYRSTPAAKLEPMKYDETVEQYLYRHSVLDGMGNMDGSFVPLSVAMIAVEKILKYELQYKPPSWIR